MRHDQLLLKLRFLLGFSRLIVRSSPAGRSIFAHSLVEFGNLVGALSVSFYCGAAQGEAINNFNGYYDSKDYKYGFHIDVNIGTATISNSPTYRPGDIILRFTTTGPTTFAGQQICTDGRFYPVTGSLSTGGLDMTIQGCGASPFGWWMVRLSSGEVTDHH